MEDLLREYLPILIFLGIAIAMAGAMVVAAFLVVAGLFRIVAALSLRLPNWGWQLLRGFVTLLLGVLIYRAWPFSGLWVIGLFVGIEMIFYGWAWIMLALEVRAVGKRKAAAA